MALIPESRDGQYPDTKEKAKKLLLGAILFGDYTLAQDGKGDRWEGGEFRPDRMGVMSFEHRIGVLNMAARWIQQQPHNVVAYKAIWNSDEMIYTLIPMLEKNHERNHDQQGLQANEEVRASGRGEGEVGQAR